MAVSSSHVGSLLHKYPSLIVLYNPFCHKHIALVLNNPLVLFLAVCRRFSETKAVPSVYTLESGVRKKVEVPCNNLLENICTLTLCTLRHSPFSNGPFTDMLYYSNFFPLEHTVVSFNNCLTFTS